MEAPIISVDRAAYHYIRDMDVDYGGMSEFYESLPAADKPPLGECHVHFSALGQWEGRFVSYGTHFYNPDDAARYDPQAPPANIVIHLGSYIEGGKLDKVGEGIKHELTHYALSRIDGPSEISDEERRAREQLVSMRSPTTRSALFIGKTIFVTGILFLNDKLTDAEASLPELTMWGAGAIAAATLVSYPRKRRERRALEEKLQTLYEQREGEQAAHAHAVTHHKIVTIVPREQKPTVFFREKGRAPVSNRLIDRTHRVMTLNPNV